LEVNTIDKQQGFTLIELLIAMVILGVVLTGVVRMFTGTGRYHATQELVVDLTQDLRAVKGLMTQEIREAGCNPLNKGPFGFQLNTDDRFDTDDNSIHFTRDIDNGNGDGILEPDGDADDPNEDIAYYRTNDACVPGGAVGAIMAAGDNARGCLRRNTGGGGQAVMPNVSEFRLFYYDEDDVELTAAQLSTQGGLDKIRTVRVLIQADVEYPDKVRQDIRSQELDFRVFVRNSTQ
jgi:prepilin-type N-terminal cleavage/methylation domain-containing protein